jgi:hypothetical protein
MNERRSSPREFLPIDDPFPELGLVQELLDRVKRPGEGWMMSVENCLKKASEAPGYTTFELALVCLAHHYGALLAEAWE